MSDQGERGGGPEQLIELAAELRRGLGVEPSEALVGAVYTQAERIGDAVGAGDPEAGASLRDRRIDRWVTSPVWGLPIMAALLGLVLWITIAGANVPSAWLAKGLFWLEELGIQATTWAGAPAWFVDLVWRGLYRCLAWVVSVMLPPMAIFFPLFTLLEDLGYLPRVAFNLDWLFRRAGAHGKQALTMAMGFGCNAAGVIACRIIESPRERLIAMLTNNFVPCNGRFPTLIVVAMLLVAPLAPTGLGSLAAAAVVFAVVALGVVITLLVSVGLSKTLLRGEPSAFALELPPYRRPRVGHVLYRSLIDRTIFVLGRAVVVAAPAGVVIWVLANVDVGGLSLATWASQGLDPIGHAVGLDGAILLAFIIALPANEIVVPTLLMIYLRQGSMLELDSLDALRSVLVEQQGWTLLTGVNLLLFVLLHHPCATTLYTLYRESGRWRWVIAGTLIPLVLGLGVCLLTTQVARALGWG